MVATNDATSSVPVILAATTALAATAAKPELGPVEIWRLGSEDGIQDRAGGGGVESVL